MLRELTKHRVLYLMTIPAMILLLLFNYFPMAGIIIAFKNFNLSNGIFASPWMHPFYENFRYFFTSDNWVSVTRNTILLNLLFIFVGTIVNVALAIMFNEIRVTWFQRTAQSLALLPYFISWIVVGVFAYNILSYEHGMLSELLVKLGMDKVDWYSKPTAWPFLILLISIWKGVGYNSIIYLATLTGIDHTLYESARIDGATRMQQIRYITVPLLRPTIIVLTLLAIGRIMNSDFGMFYSLVGDNAQLYSTVDVIDTFVFRSLKGSGDMGMAAAASFYQSVLAFVLVYVSNRVARKYESGSALF
ncbi:ABC transporter permease [Gorillibacterium massiliense]|uniref:ABC transporter permease n=1 Tax=Gorillibacterium massiliense TaxID=1280390 RepID=UPI0004AEFA71|nr:ABC transporter permease subunit [Gorillibacterium massiliense]